MNRTTLLTLATLGLGLTACCIPAAPNEQVEQKLQPAEQPKQPNNQMTIAAIRIQQPDGEVQTTCNIRSGGPKDDQIKIITVNLSSLRGEPGAMLYGYADTGSPIATRLYEALKTGEERRATIRIKKGSYGWLVTEIVD